VIDPANLPTFSKMSDPKRRDLWGVQGGPEGVSCRAERGNGPVKTLRDVIDFKERYRDREMPYSVRERLLIRTPKAKGGQLSSKGFVSRSGSRLNHMARQEDGASTGGYQAALGMLWGAPKDADGTGWPRIPVEATTLRRRRSTHRGHRGRDIRHRDGAGGDRCSDCCGLSFFVAEGLKLMKHNQVRVRV